MKPTELDFAHKVRSALNETLPRISPDADRSLAEARRIALTHKKADAPVRIKIISRKLAGHGGDFFNGPLAWLLRMGLVLPLLVAAIGLMGIYQVEKQQRIQENAEIDADVLSDELPVSAYLDNGFNVYWTKKLNEHHE
jgi:hypothetical protein